MTESVKILIETKDGKLTEEIWGIPTGWEIVGFDDKPSEYDEVVTYQDEESGYTVIFDARLIANGKGLGIYTLNYLGETKIGSFSTIEETSDLMVNVIADIFIQAWSDFELQIPLHSHYDVSYVHYDTIISYINTQSEKIVSFDILNGFKGEYMQGNRNGKYKGKSEMYRLLTQLK